MGFALRLLIIGGLLALAACVTTTGSQQAPKLNPQAQAVTAYRIGVDDEVKVSVWQNPGLDVSVPVRPDGKISVPLVGDIDAGGRTPEEVAAPILFLCTPQAGFITGEVLNVNGGAVLVG